MNWEKKKKYKFEGNFGELPKYSCKNEFLCSVFKVL